MHRVLVHYYYKNLDYCCTVEDGAEFLKIAFMAKEYDLPLVVNQFDDGLQKFVEKSKMEIFWIDDIDITIPTKESILTINIYFQDISTEEEN